VEKETRQRGSLFDRQRCGLFLEFFETDHGWSLPKVCASRKRDFQPGQR
jgi:hypothetical protein